MTPASSPTDSHKAWELSGFPKEGPIEGSPIPVDCSQMWAKDQEDFAQAAVVASMYQKIQKLTQTTSIQPISLPVLAKVSTHVLQVTGSKCSIAPATLMSAFVLSTFFLRTALYINLP